MDDRLEGGRKRERDKSKMLFKATRDKKMWGGMIISGHGT